MNEFPSGESRFLIDGACGALQLATMTPKKAMTSKELQNDNVGHGEGESQAGIVVVVCHPHPLMGGTMNNKVVHTIARCHRDLGRKVVRFNFRGVDKSEGEYAQGVGESDDLLAVLRWVRLVRPNDRIMLAGFSFGSYVAARSVQLALDEGCPIISLLLIAPAVENYDFENYTSFPVPVGVIVGDSDEVVAPSAIFSWFESVASAKQQLVLKGAGHFFHGQLTELKGLVEKLSL